MRNRSQKNAETLLLEPTKNKAKPKKKVLGERMRKSRASAGFVPKPLRNYSLKVLGERMRKSRAPAGFVPKPLRNYSLKVLGERMRKAEPQQVLCLSHCETAAGKMPKRCFWNPLIK